MNHSIKKLFLSSALCLSAAYASADGRIEGRVSDVAGNVYFTGAIIKLKELNLEVNSKQGGRFSFQSVPAGTYTLVVDYLGAETVKRQITIKDDQVTKETVSIGSDVSSMENVIVVGQAAGASSALNKQRSADNFVSVVSSDSIGQFPDENVSEALQRVPGVFIERDQGEGRFVGVRGLSPDLNSASINGVNIPSPERDRRSVALDVIPSGLLEGLEVTKTVTPDMDGNMIGGNIEVKSLSAFDRDGRSYKVSAEGNYNDQVDKVSPKASGSFTDIFQMGEGELGVAAAISWQDREFGSETIEAEDEWDSDIEDSGERGNAEMQQRDYAVNRERLGAALNFDWRPNDSSEYYLRNLYSHFEDQEYRQRMDYAFDKGDLQSITESSADWTDARTQRELKDRFEEQKILSVVLGGLNTSGDWTYEYSLGYSKSSENEPDRIDAQFEQKGVDIGYSSLGSVPKLYAEADAYDASLYELNEVVVENNYTEDELFTYKFDVTREMSFSGHPGIVKFGGKLTQREKTDDVGVQVFDDFGDAGDPTMEGFVDGNVNYGLGRMGPALSESALRDFVDSNLLGSGSRFQEDGSDGEAFNESIVSSARDYVMEETVAALYAMSRVDIGDLRVVYGLRYESTDFNADGFEARLIEGSSGFSSQVDAVKYDNDYDNWFPSLNLRYRLNEKTQLRAAFSQTIARPSFGDITPSPEEISIEDGELSVEAGNPNLEPFESDNFDLSIEYYPGDIGVVSAGFFYKKIDNFIVSADVSGLVDSSVYAPGVTITDSEILMPINGESADLYGLELAYTKNFDSGILLQANVTLTDSEADLGLSDSTDRSSKIKLPEQADTTGNLVLGYERGPWSLRVSAAYKSENLRGINVDDAAEDTHQDDHLQIDLSAKFDVSDTVQLYFNGVNLNDEPFYVYQGAKNYNAQYEEYGPSYVLGVTYRNF